MDKKLPTTETGQQHENKAGKVTTTKFYLTSADKSVSNGAYGCGRLKASGNQTVNTVSIYLPPKSSSAEDKTIATARRVKRLPPTTTVVYTDRSQMPWLHKNGSVYKNLHLSPGKRAEKSQNEALLHRLNEKRRHKDTTDLLTQLSSVLPASSDIKETKVMLLQRVVAYFCFLEKKIDTLCGQLGKDPQFYRLSNVSGNIHCADSICRRVQNLDVGSFRPVELLHIYLNTMMEKPELLNGHLVTSMSQQEVDSATAELFRVEDNPTLLFAPATLSLSTDLTETDHSYMKLTCSKQLPSASLATSTQEQLLDCEEEEELSLPSVGLPNLDEMLDENWLNGNMDLSLFIET